MSSSHLSFACHQSIQKALISLASTSFNRARSTSLSRPRSSNYTNYTRASFRAYIIAPAIFAPDDLFPSFFNTKFAVLTMAGDITCEVVLTPMPRREVKGNKETIWSSMLVLQGLDHRVFHFPFPISHFPFPISHFPFPISHFPFPFFLHYEPVRPPRRLSPDMFGCLSVGRSIDGLSRGQNTILLLSSLSAANSLNVSASVAPYQNETL